MKMLDKMLIVITGTPGTGKTEVAKALSKIMKIRILDVKGLVKRKKIFKAGKNKGKNRSKEKEIEVDAGKLEKALKAELKTRKDAIIENHMLCEFGLPADFVFVLRTKPNVLEKRLLKRKYPDKKLHGNLISEMLDYCSIKTKLNYQTRQVEIDTAGLTALQTAKKIALVIRQGKNNKKRSVDNVDYTNYLKRYLKLK